MAEEGAADRGRGVAGSAAGDDSHLLSTAETSSEGQTAQHKGTGSGGAGAPATGRADDDGASGDDLSSAPPDDVVDSDESSSSFDDSDIGSVDEEAAARRAADRERRRNAKAVKRVSQHHGVVWHRVSRRWTASYKGKYCGSYVDETLAAAAVDRAAIAAGEAAVNDTTEEQQQAAAQFRASCRKGARFTGVHKVGEGKFAARFKGRQVGVFDDERSAAAAYDVARQDHGLQALNDTTKEEQASVREQVQPVSPEDVSMRWLARRGVWAVWASNRGARVHIGDFETEEAAKAAKEAAVAAQMADWKSGNGEPATTGAGAAAAAQAAPAAQRAQAAPAADGEATAPMVDTSTAKATVPPLREPPQQTAPPQSAPVAAAGRATGGAQQPPTSTTDAAAGDPLSKLQAKDNDEKQTASPADQKQQAHSVGVAFNRGKFVVQKNGQYLGRFPTERLAAAAFDAACIAEGNPPQNDSTEEERAIAAVEMDKVVRRRKEKAELARQIREGGVPEAPASHADAASKTDESAVPAELAAMIKMDGGVLPEGEAPPASSSNVDLGVGASEHTGGAGGAPPDTGVVNGPELAKLSRDASSTVERPPSVLSAGSRKPRGPKSSRYRGVSWLDSKMRWRAQCSIDSKGVYLGHFKHERLAAAMYDAIQRARHKRMVNETTAEEQALACMIRMKSTRPGETKVDNLVRAVMAKLPKVTDDTLPELQQQSVPSDKADRAVRRKRDAASASKRKKRGGKSTKNKKGRRSSSSNPFEVALRPKRADASSRYYGVSYLSKKKVYRSQIGIGAKDRHIGHFDDELMAGAAYDCARTLLGLKPVNDTTEEQRAKAAAKCQRAMQRIRQLRIEFEAKIAAEAKAAGVGSASDSASSSGSSSSSDEGGEGGSDDAIRPARVRTGPRQAVGKCPGVLTDGDHWFAQHDGVMLGCFAKATQAAAAVDLACGRPALTIPAKRVTKTVKEMLSPQQTANATIRWSRKQQAFYTTILLDGGKRVSVGDFTTHMVATRARDAAVSYYTSKQQITCADVPLQCSEDDARAVAAEVLGDTWNGVTMSAEQAEQVLRRLEERHAASAKRGGAADGAGAAAAAGSTIPPTGAQASEAAAAGEGAGKGAGDAKNEDSDNAKAAKRPRVDAD